MSCTKALFLKNPSAKYQPINFSLEFFEICFEWEGRLFGFSEALRTSPTSKA